MAIGEVGQQNYHFPIFKARLRFVIQDTVRAQIIDTEIDNALEKIIECEASEVYHGDYFTVIFCKRERSEMGAR